MRHRVLLAVATNKTLTGRNLRHCGRVWACHERLSPGWNVWPAVRLDPMGEFMKANASMVLVAFICLASVGTANAAGLDHFLCYKAAAKPALTVNLSDQFDTGAYTSKATKAFCTPADKNGEGISDLQTHLTVYKIKGPHARRTGVTLQNEFGTFTYDTLKADTLLVPANKSLAPAPPPAAPVGTLVDHYRCLKAKSTTAFPKGTVVSVVDQFGTRQIEVIKPATVCLATNKNGEGINRPSSHLVCYKVKATPTTSPPGVQTTDQFGTLRFDAKKEAQLCVPSTFIGEACPIGFDVSIIARGAGTASETRIETGWAGLDHDRDGAGGYPLRLDATCAGTATPCGVCTIDGLSAGKPGRCFNNEAVACDAIGVADADDCGGAPCYVHFRAPEPSIAGNSPFCRLQVLASDIAGTVDNETGDAQISVDMLTHAYWGGSASYARPCPVCLGDSNANDGVRAGVCEGGARDGQPCDTSGVDPTFGPTSIECPPDPGTLLTGAGQRERVNLTTGTVSLPASTACDAPLGAFSCWCGMCVDNPGLVCSANADCATCATNSDCGGGVCDGSHCGCTTVGSGVARVPNRCDNVFDCTDTGGEMGECGATTPPGTFCDGFLRADGTPLIECSNNADCAATRCDDSLPPGPGGCGLCTMERARACFLDPIEATGVPIPGRPLLVAALCLPPTNNGAVNHTAGLPGPERVSLRVSLGRRY